jgi:hypothetical protein
VSDTLYVNADWSAIVPAGSIEARFGVARKDAIRLGLLSGKAEEPAPATIATANVKQVAKPADKAVRKPPNK